MENKKAPNRYSEDFKKSIVTLYQNGKSQAQLIKEYGVSQSAIFDWIKKYSEVKIDSDTVMTAQQIKQLQKRNAQLEEATHLITPLRKVFSNI